VARKDGYAGRYDVLLARSVLTFLIRKFMKNIVVHYFETPFSMRLETGIGHHKAGSFVIS
jgi:hypothetical protein